MEDYQSNQSLRQANKPVSWSKARAWWGPKHDDLIGPYRSPVRLLMMIIVAVFAAEVVAMIVIAIISKYAARSIPYSQITIIDAGIMTILIVPVLYSLSFRPLLRHYESERHARQTAETMRAATQALTQTLELETVVKTLLEHISTLVETDVATIGFLEDETRLVIRVAEGFERWSVSDSDAAPVFPIEIKSDYLLQRLDSSHKALFIQDVAQDAEWINYQGTSPIHNWLGVPILVSNKVIGVVLLGKIQPAFYTLEHAGSAEALVSQAAVAIQNAWLFEQVRAGRERLQFLSRRLVEIQETERRYIARELHDQAGQSLSYLMLGLGQLEKDASKLIEVQSQVKKLKMLTNNILEDLHRLAVNLRPASLDHLGLVPALEQFIKTFADESHLQIHFKSLGLQVTDRLPADIETTLYRIVQESLTNILRHAKASHADVILEHRDGSLLLIVEDNGIGFDPELACPNDHLGLLGMQERAEMLDGSFAMESVPGQGTTIFVEVPHVNPNPVGR